MNDTQLRKCLGLDRIDVLFPRNIDTLQKEVYKLKRIIGCLLEELGYEYQESCRENLPRLNNIQQPIMKETKRRKNETSKDS